MITRTIDKSIERLYEKKTARPLRLLYFSFSQPKNLFQRLNSPIRKRQKVLLEKITGLAGMFRYQTSKRIAKLERKHKFLFGSVVSSASLKDRKPKHELRLKI